MSTACLSLPVLSPMTNPRVAHSGMVPDGGTDGGSQDTLATLNDLVSSTGGKHATFGQYAQAKSGTTFDGSQLLQVMDDLKSSGAIFGALSAPHVSLLVCLCGQ